MSDPRDFKPLPKPFKMGKPSMQPRRSRGADQYDVDDRPRHEMQRRNVPPRNENRQRQSEYATRPERPVRPNQSRQGERPRRPAPDQSRQAERPRRPGPEQSRQAERLRQAEPPRQTERHIQRERPMRPERMDQPRRQERPSMPRRPISDSPGRPNRPAPVRGTPTRRSRPQSRAPQRRTGRRNAILGGALLALMAVVVVFIATLGSGGVNVLTLYLDGERFVYIDTDREIEEAEVLAEVTRRLEAIEGAEVRINEVITLGTASGSGQEVLPYSEAIERLITELSFQIVGVAIEVDNRRVAVLRTQDEVDQIVWNLQSPFRVLDEYVSVDFVENFSTSRAAVPSSEISSISAAMQELGSSVPVTQEYIVQPNDVLSVIASNHGISENQLLADNPHISNPNNLRIGDVLLIQTMRPFLSVRTVEEVTRTEFIGIEVERRENPGAPRGFSEILQQGIQGEREVVIHITKVNGIQQGPEQVVDSRMIEYMQPQIVEIGVMDPEED